MDTIYADYSISMSEFKKNPAQVLRTAGEKPVAVLNHNRPAFYMVTPKLFEALVASPPSAVEAHVVPMERLLVEWPAVQLTAEGLEWARHGRDLGPRQLSGAPAPPARIVRMLAPDGRLAGLATPAKAAGLLHPTVVFS